MAVKQSNNGIYRPNIDKHACLFVCLFVCAFVIAMRGITTCHTCDHAEIHRKYRNV